MSKSLTEVKVPYYYIAINGVELDELRMSNIESITYEDSASGSDLLKITLYDPDLLFIEDNIFIEEATINFVGGWYRGDVTRFEGFISVIDIDLPESGTPLITLNCMDKTHIMNRKKNKKTWENMKVSAIASQIFRSYGLSAVVDDTGKVEESISQDATDISFLIQQASDQYDTYLCYVEGKTGYFIKKPNLATPQDTLEYRQGNGKLLSFSPRINKQVKQLEVTKSDVNTKDNQVDSATVNDTISRPTSGETVKPNWIYDPSSGKWTHK